MAKVSQISSLPDLMASIENEWWSEHPEQYADYCRLVGLRIEQVEMGDITEQEYIAEWREKYPSQK